MSLTELDIPATAVDTEPSEQHAPTRTLSHDEARRLRARVGGVTAAAALVLIWCCRATLEGEFYVSAMGATGVATGPWFNLSLVMVGAATLLVSTAVTGEPSRSRTLSLWPSRVTFVMTAAMFALAGAVPCTAGCPVPFSPGSTFQDLVHVAAAVAGFAGAVFAVLQVWSAAHSRRLRALSAGVMVFVAVSALAGAMDSLTGILGGIGGWCEFAAMTAALGWLAGYGIFLSRSARRAVTRPVDPRGESRVIYRGGPVSTLALPSDSPLDCTLSADPNTREVQ